MACLASNPAMLGQATSIEGQRNDMIDAPKMQSSVPAATKKPWANAQGVMCAQEQLQHSWTIEDVDVDWPLMNTWLSSCRV